LVLFIDCDKQRKSSANIRELRRQSGILEQSNRGRLASRRLCRRRSVQLIDLDMLSMRRQASERLELRNLSISGFVLGRICQPRQLLQPQAQRSITFRLQFDARNLLAREE
jgi:hypothetical protein